MITNIVTQPTLTAGEISLLSPETQLQIQQWNAFVPQASEGCVHHLIERHFQDSPRSLAVNAWDGDLTYEALNQLSSRLAARLVQLGSQPETFIPLLFEKSMWTVVSMVAVMRANAAFVLMDPKCPKRRLEDICADCEARIILSSTPDQKTLSHLPLKVLVVNAETAGLWPSIATLPSLARPQNAVYAVYTSGSTGAPKGVVIEHASFSATIEANKGQ